MRRPIAEPVTPEPYSPNERVLRAKIGGLDAALGDVESRLALVEDVVTPSPGASMADRLEAIENAVRFRSLTHTVSSVLSVGNHEIAITLPAGMMDTNYSVNATAEHPASLLGKCSCAVKQGSKTTTGFVLLVANTGLVPITVGQLSIHLMIFGNGWH